MGVAHRGRSGNSACRSGTTRERPGASAAGVGAVRGGLGHSSSESRQARAFEHGLKWFAYHSGLGRSESSPQPGEEPIDDACSGHFRCLLHSRDVDIRRLGRLVRAVDAGEIRDLAGHGLDIEALWIAADTLLERYVDKDLREFA